MLKPRTTAVPATTELAAKEVPSLVECDAAPGCDCHKCDDKCIVNTKDFKGCFFPPNEAFCNTWMQEQCGDFMKPPSGTRRPNPFGTGGLPSIGMLKPRTTAVP